MKKRLKRWASFTLAFVISIGIAGEYKSSEVKASELVTTYKDGCMINTFEYNNHKYGIVQSTTASKGYTWYEAENLAEKWGGHLVTITDSNEQEEIKNNIIKLNDSVKKNYWIGLYRDLQDNNTWKWVTGESYSYNNFATGEPNNYNDRVESYVHIIAVKKSSTKTVGKWNDATDSGAAYADSFYSTYNYGFIYEYEDGNHSATSSYQKGTISFTPQTKSENVNVEYYYKDDYFKGDSTKYNSSLSTMSLCLELSSWRGYQNAIDIDKVGAAGHLLEIELGFRDVDTSAYHIVNSKGEVVNSTEDSIAYVLANKTFVQDGKNTTVVAIAVRGGSYGREWSSNFDMGSTGEHEGFSNAAGKIATHLKKYINDHNYIKSSNRVVFWITGYSRAGAVANLVAGNLLNGTYDIGTNVKTENVYAYCFEPAQGAVASKTMTNSSQYDCIFNIVNPNDVVTYVAPKTSGFEFARYGITYYLPQKNTVGVSYNTYLNKMKKRLAAILGDSNFDIEKTYGIDGFTSIDAHIGGKWSIAKVIKLLKDEKRFNYPMNYFMEDTVDILAEDFFVSRSNYVNKYQETIRSLVGVAMCEDAKNDFLNYEKTLFKNVITIIKERYSVNFIRAVLNGNVTNATQIAYAAVLTALNAEEKGLYKALEEAGIDYDGDIVKDTKTLISDALTKFVARNPLIVVDMIRNGEYLFQPHYPECTLAWVQSFDFNYESNYSEWGYQHGYDRVGVKCPVDVEVKDSNGKTVALISDDKAVNIEDGLESFVDYDGQKVVIIPDDTNYKFYIKATDKGSVNCSIKHYSIDNKCNKIENFYDIPVEDGEVMDLNVEDSEGDDNHSHTIQKGTNIVQPSEVFDGDEYVDKYSVSVQSEYGGKVFGAKHTNRGEAAMVRALPDSGYELKGWYVDDVLVSTDEKYSFIVTSDIVLTAKFEKKDCVVEINGFQINTKFGGVRTIFSTNYEEDEIEETGLIYGLEYGKTIEDEKMIVNSDDGYVRNFGISSLDSNCQIPYSSLKEALTYSMTMTYGANTKTAMTVGYKIRAYVKLTSGEYVYSDIERYTTFDIAKTLYENNMSTNYNSHKKLYTDVLVIVDPYYKELDYNWNNTIDTTRNSDDESRVVISGYSISSTSKIREDDVPGGLRVVYSNDYDENEIRRTGILIKRNNSVSDDDFIIDNDKVINVVATDKGKLSKSFMPFGNGCSYAMTFTFGNSYEKSMMEFLWQIRSYVELNDGTIVYSKINKFSIFEVAQNIYDNGKMPTVDSHNFLFDRIITLVDPNHKKIEYDWNNSLVK